MGHHRLFERAVNGDAAAFARALAHLVEQAAPAVRRGDRVEHARDVALASERGIGPGRRPGGVVHHAQMQRAGAASAFRHCDQPQEFRPGEFRPQAIGFEEARRDRDERLGVDLLVAPRRRFRRAFGLTQRGPGRQIQAARERPQRPQPAGPEPLTDLMQGQARGVEHAGPFQAVGRNDLIIDRLADRERIAIGAVGDEQVVVELATLSQNLHRGHGVAGRGGGHQRARDAGFRRAAVELEIGAHAAAEGADRAGRIDRDQRVRVALAHGMIEIERLYAGGNLGARARAAARGPEPLQE